MFTLLWLLLLLRPFLRHPHTQHAHNPPQHPGCITPEFLEDKVKGPVLGAGYFISKMGNVMHAVELPRHHPGIMALAIDQGWVGTNIQPWMQGLFSPVNLKWMRDAETGAGPAVVALAVGEDELRAKIKENAGRGMVVTTLNQIRPAFRERWWHENINTSQDTMHQYALSLWDFSIKETQE